MQQRTQRDDKNLTGEMQISCATRLDGGLLARCDPALGYGVSFLEALPSSED
ncbi:hypothetical protein QNM99_06835 [Pseudomonas sp. PCH446]